MIIRDLINELEYTLVTDNISLDRNISGVYTCDLLSYAISKLREEDAWVTVIGNINTAAVASLADASCIILADSSLPDSDLIEKCNLEGIPLFKTKKSAVQIILDISKLL